MTWTNLSIKKTHKYALHVESELKYLRRVLNEIKRGGADSEL